MPETARCGVKCRFPTSNVRSGERRRWGGLLVLLGAVVVVTFQVAGPDFAVPSSSTTSGVANFGGTSAGLRASTGLQRSPAVGATSSAEHVSEPPAPGIGRFVIPLLFGLVVAFVPRMAFAATKGAATPSFGAVMHKAAGRAFRGGLAGMFAGVAQVLTFMWLRTSMNYQYVNGGSLGSALRHLWNEGGIGRLYQGLPLAIIQAPLSRFGDTAANAGTLALMQIYFPNLSVPTKTAVASAVAGLWRVFLTPIDTLKTARQVQGKKAMDLLIQRVKQNGIGELYAGCFANFAANYLGSYPYFATFNVLSHLWPAPEEKLVRIVRTGIIGMCSSITSDTVSNSLRVLKTLRQASSDSTKGYWGSAQEIIEKDGLWGLLGRGLETRLLVNVLQGTFFAIMWRLIEENMGR